MSFPENYATCEPLPWGMVRIKCREVPSMLDRYFGMYRRRPVPEPRHVKDDA